MPSCMLSAFFVDHNRQPWSAARALSRLRGRAGAGALERRMVPGVEARSAGDNSYSSRHLPGGHRLTVGVLAVLQHHAHRREFVTNAIGFLEISRVTCGETRGNLSF
jgi:hypothetical protein